jgi:hypothetical protein
MAETLRWRDIVVPSEGFSACFEGGLVGDFLDEIEDHVFDDSHVGGAVCGSQAHEIVVEDDVEHPMEAVLDAPTGSCRGGELFRESGAQER